MADINEILKKYGGTIQPGTPPPPGDAPVMDDPRNPFLYKTKEGIPVYSATPGVYTSRAPGDMPMMRDIAAGFGENLVQSGEGLVNMVEGAYNTVAHPYETFAKGEKGLVKGLADVGSAQDALRLKVIDAIKRRDYPTASLNALYYMIPMLGPQLSEQSAMAARGEWGRSIGHTGATAAQLAAPEMLKGTQVPLSPRYTVKTQLNPVEQANQAFLQREGVQTPLSMQTGSRPAAMLQGSVQQSIGGSQYAQEARQTTRQQIRNVAGQKLQQVQPGAAVTPEQAGQAVLGKFKGDIQALEADANTAYKEAWKVENDPANIQEVPKEVETPNGWEYVTDPQGNVIVEDMKLPQDMRPIKAALRPIAARYARTMSKTDQNASLGLATMREIINGPDYKPLSQAESDLGLLKKAAKQERGMKELRDTSQGLAAFSLGQLQQEIDATMAGAQGGQQGLQNLQKGRSSTAQKWGIYEQVRKFGKPNIEDLEPVAVYNKLTGDKDIRTQFLKRIRAMAPAQMPMVGRAFMEELLNRVFREGDLGHTQQALNEWDALGRESKLVLFRNANVVDDLDQTMVAMKRMAAEVNPSGTGYMQALNNLKQLLGTALGAAVGGASGGTGGMGLGAAVGGVGGTIATNAALARLLYNPKYSRLLRQGIQLQLKGDKAGAAAVIGLLSKAANEAPPQTERPPLELFVK